MLSHVSCHMFFDPMDCNPQYSSVQGISQARILEWVPISFSNMCIYMHANMYVRIECNIFLLNSTVLKQRNVFAASNSNNDSNALLFRVILCVASTFTGLSKGSVLIIYILSSCQLASFHLLPWCAKFWAYMHVISLVCPNTANSQDQMVLWTELCSPKVHVLNSSSAVW